MIPEVFTGWGMACFWIRNSSETNIQAGCRVFALEIQVRGVEHNRLWVVWMGSWPCNMEHNNIAA
jgi:hypothetical protein